MCSVQRTSLVLDALPFVVDTWDNDALRAEKPHFLSHPHKDHTTGIEDMVVGVDVYCTHRTLELLLVRQPAAAKRHRFRCVKLHEPATVTYGSQTFTVIAVNANHCPGACIFLFQGAFGSVLHTGDCRLTQPVIQDVLGVLKGEVLDMLYLDCTFADLPLDFPSRKQALSQLEALLAAHPFAHRVHLSCDMLGMEPILELVAKRFCKQLYLCAPQHHAQYCFINPEVVEQRRQELQLLLPGLLTDDPRARFHLCGVEDFKGKGGGAGGGSKGVLHIRASTQHTAQRLRARYRDCPSDMLALRVPEPAPCQASEQDGVHYILYSIHSSRSELLAALDQLAPRAFRPISADQAAAVTHGSLLAERQHEPPEVVEQDMVERMAYALQLAPCSRELQAAAAHAEDAAAASQDAEAAWHPAPALPLPCGSVDSRILPEERSPACAVDRSKRRRVCGPDVDAPALPCQHMLPQWREPGLLPGKVPSRHAAAPQPLSAATAHVSPPRTATLAGIPACLPGSRPRPLPVLRSPECRLHAAAVPHTASLAGIVTTLGKASFPGLRAPATMSSGRPQPFALPAPVPCLAPASPHTGSLPERLAAASASAPASCGAPLSPVACSPQAGNAGPRCDALHPHQVLATAAAAAPAAMWAGILTAGRPSVQRCHITCASGISIMPHASPATKGAQHGASGAGKPPNSLSPRKRPGHHSCQVGSAAEATHAAAATVEGAAVSGSPADGMASCKQGTCGYLISSPAAAAAAVMHDRLAHRAAVDAAAANAAVQTARAAAACSWPIQAVAGRGAPCDSAAAGAAAAAGGSAVSALDSMLARFLRNKDDLAVPGARA